MSAARASSANERECREQNQQCRPWQRRRGPQRRGGDADTLRNRKAFKIAVKIILQFRRADDVAELGQGASVWIDLGKITPLGYIGRTRLGWNVGENYPQLASGI